MDYNLNCKRMYLKVDVRFMENGDLLPLAIYYRDVKYEITRVKVIERMAASRSGGGGIAFYCVINGKTRCLYYAHDLTSPGQFKYRWFAEVPIYEKEYDPHGYYADAPC